MTSLDVDHSGSRLLAGSRDYSLRMFDFNGMKSDMRSFRRLEPSDGHPVHSVSAPQVGTCAMPHIVTNALENLQATTGVVSSPGCTSVSPLSSAVHPCSDCC